MDLMSRLQFFAPLDGIAVGTIALSWLLIGLIIENPPARRPSVSVLMADYRREWMKQYVTRDPRVFDAITLNGLREGTSFFASTCLIAIGGGLALIGNTERLLGLAEDLSLDNAPAVIWEMKVLLVLLFLVNALLKFIWANRLFGYNAVVMGAVPNDASDLAYARAAQSAEINIHAVRNFNRGLRAVYFALAALAWLLGPIPLMIATALALGTLWRREFASHSRGVLLQGKTP
jgi:uncharacterized membrane protein